jgi:hypothetical protein
MLFASQATSPVAPMTNASAERRTPRKTRLTSDDARTVLGIWGSV